MGKKSGTDTPKGINLLTLSTSVRWFGWGLGEAFIPVFFLFFADSFLGVGMLASVYSILFFLSIPFSSYLADSIKTKRMIMAGLIIYIFIGLGYFLAGLTSAVIFLVLARALNGISFSLDLVGRETYIMRHVPKPEESRTFGKFDFITNFWWIFAVVIGIFLVKYVPIHWLLFFITPTSIISFFIVMKIKEKELRKRSASFSVKRIYQKFFREIRNFSRGLRLLAVMTFVFGIISSIIYFFAPAISYSQGESIVRAVIIVLVYSLPGLFGKYLGKLADRKKEKVFFPGMLLLIPLLAGLIYTSNYYIILAIVFLAGVVFELFSLTNQGIIARLADKKNLGEADGSMNAIGSLGAVAGPILFGFLIDKINVPMAYIFIIIIVSLLSIYIFKRKDNLRS